jgi:hypothetical protein
MTFNSVCVCVCAHAHVWFFSCSAVWMALKSRDATTVFFLRHNPSSDNTDSVCSLLRQVKPNVTSERKSGHISQTSLSVELCWHN